MIRYLSCFRVYPEVWLSHIAANKGGYVLVPAAPVLTVEDIKYRLESSFPSAVLVDDEGAEKIDAVERSLKQEGSREDYHW